jgi:hypothetical protein
MHQFVLPAVESQNYIDGQFEFPKQLLGSSPKKVVESQNAAAAQYSERHHRVFQQIAGTVAAVDKRNINAIRARTVAEQYHLRALDDVGCLCVMDVFIMQIYIVLERIEANDV